MGSGDGLGEAFRREGQDGDTSGESDAEGAQGTAAGTTECNFGRGGPATSAVGGQF
jgi:hypothetical protein